MSPTDLCDRVERFVDLSNSGKKNDHFKYEWVHFMSGGLQCICTYNYSVV